MKFEFDLENRNAMTYDEYRNHIDFLLDTGKTTGPNQSEKYIGYTQMAVARMTRWDKRFELSSESKELILRTPKQKWIVITEAWCGDSAQIIPIINKFCASSPKIELCLIYRDENPDITNAFLTNGTRSIPKLIAIDENKEILFTWGPRPKHLQEIMVQGKKRGVSHGILLKEIHTKYALEKGLIIEAELLAILKSLEIKKAS